MDVQLLFVELLHELIKKICRSVFKVTVIGRINLEKIV